MVHGRRPGGVCCGWAGGGGGEGAAETALALPPPVGAHLPFLVPSPLVLLSRDSLPAGKMPPPPAPPKEAAETAAKGSLRGRWGVGRGPVAANPEQRWATQPTQPRQVRPHREDTERSSSRPRRWPPTSVSPVSTNPPFPPPPPPPARKQANSEDAADDRDEARSPPPPPPAARSRNTPQMRACGRGGGRLIQSPSAGGGPVEARSRDGGVGERAVGVGLCAPPPVLDSSLRTTRGGTAGRVGGPVGGAGARPTGLAVGQGAALHTLCLAGTFGGRGRGRPFPHEVAQNRLLLAGPSSETQMPGFFHTYPPAFVWKYNVIIYLFSRNSRRYDTGLAKILRGLHGSATS